MKKDREEEKKQKKYMNILVLIKVANPVKKACKIRDFGIVLNRPC